MILGRSVASFCCIVGLCSLLVGCQRPRPPAPSATPSVVHPPAADVRFIDTMTYQHQAAIKMAEEGRKQAQDPQVLALCDQILSNEVEQVKQMSIWRQTWYPQAPPLPEAQQRGGKHPGALAVPDGLRSYDQRWSVAMSDHHRASLELARGYQQRLEHPELQKLASDIQQRQQKELQTLQTLTGQSPGKTGKVSASPHP